jgi:hypothetical protein
VTSVVRHFSDVSEESTARQDRKVGKAAQEAELVVGSENGGDTFLRNLCERATGSGCVVTAGSSLAVRFMSRAQAAYRSQNLSCILLFDQHLATEVARAEARVGPDVTCPLLLLSELCRDISENSVREVTRWRV